VNLRDRFEWDLADNTAGAPEVFSRQLASDLGIGGEFVAIIAHAIREQLYRHKKQLVDEVRRHLLVDILTMSVLTIFDDSMDLKEK
jgi:hypothetical protein